MKKKHAIDVLLSVLLVALIASSTTLAYFVVSTDPLINTFTFAKVDTEIEEPNEGTAQQKKPVIVNEGDTDVFVRARVIVATLPDSSQLMTAEDLLFQYNDSRYSPFQDTDWIDTEAYWDESHVEADGWYYYSQKLASGNRTEPLFDGLRVKETVKEDAKFDVIVYHESVIAGNSQNAYEAFNPSVGD